MTPRTYETAMSAYTKCIQQRDKLRSENADLRTALAEIIAWRKRDRPADTRNDWYEEEFRRAIELIAA